MRGEVWWAELAGDAGFPPVVMVSRAEGLQTWVNVTVAEVTRVERSIPCEVHLSPTEGMPVQCVVNTDNLHTIPKDRLRQESPCYPANACLHSARHCNIHSTWNSRRRIRTGWPAETDPRQVWSGLPNLLFADVSLHRTPGGMTAEFKFPSGRLPPNVFRRFHFGLSRSTIGLSKSAGSA